MKNEKALKIITLGAKGVGKVNISNFQSSFINRVINGVFQDEILIPKICSQKTLVTQNYSVQLSLWDFASQERSWQQLKDAYYGFSDGILLMFDLSNEGSFKEMVDLHQGFQYQMKVSMLVVGCKCDLEKERKVSYDVAYSFAHNFGMNYFETSAKCNKNCEETIQFFIQQVLGNINVKLKPHNQIDKCW